MHLPAQRVKVSAHGSVLLNNGLRYGDTSLETVIVLVLTGQPVTTLGYG